jgi:hypothetical protein
MMPPGGPSAIGRYQILDVIGSGAMGTVYQARDPAIGRDVAIKVVRIDADSAQERAASIARFRQEVQTAGRCSHPAIVAIYDFLDESGDPAIVMELVEGSTLRRILRDPATRAASLLPDVPLQVLDGLGYAHGQGIIHRDIKPANILVTLSGEAKIADFGIARLTSNSAASHATLVGEMLGTPSYMAPEQLTNDRVDNRTDLFAVGAILYEMLAGKAPFAGQALSETILRLASADAADMAPIEAVEDGRFVSVLQRALAKDRTLRFQTADEFAAALRAASPDANRIVPDVSGATVVLGSFPVGQASFDPALLQGVELHLARFVGPMARMMVARATQQARTVNDLYTLLARELPNAADRSMFLRLVGGGRVEPCIGGRGGPGQTMAPRTRAPLTVAPNTSAPRTSAPRTSAPRIVEPETIPPRRPAAELISPAALAAAQAALVVHVGPIARVLVRDAATGATSGRDFIDRLCAHVTKPEDRAVLQRRLRAEVEPKLG